MSSIIKDLKASMANPSPIWDTATVENGSVVVDPSASRDEFAKTVFSIQRRELKEKGWQSTRDVDGKWVLTPPSTPAESETDSPIDRAVALLSNPAQAWQNATASGRVVTIPAHAEQPYLNAAISEDLEVLRRHEWFVGAITGSGGVVAYTAEAPVAKQAAPKSQREALGRIADLNNPQSFVDEAVEADGRLVYRKDSCSTYSMNAARAVARRAAAEGWSVEQSGPPGEVTTISFKAPERLVRA